ncbi:MAG: hypothetical protein JWO92_2403 [Chitinophagaceae bacterium]|nr:hypothetical protein [Chitinophagaceae bacterium]MDB5221782.1 hypothetical protein [Chitinophagaceae bacterium]
MKSALLFFIGSLICDAVVSQPSDFIVVKKDQRTVKSFFAGSNIAFETVSGYYSGQINALQRDSLFLTQFDVRQVPTRLGVMVLDTVATYRLGFNYKEITKIENQKRKGFDWSASGGSLFGGGILITAIGLGTWIFTKPGTKYHASPGLIISAAGLAGVGYLLLRSNNSYYSIGKKYQLEYIKVK